MGKLHEILAVDKELEDTAKKVVAEATVTFDKKKDLFSGHIKRLKMFADERQMEEEAASEDKAMVTTVGDKLAYVAQHLIRHLNVIAQKERTNQSARADVILKDGSTIMSNVPATLLLTLENKLAWLRKMYETIPTLQPGVKWEEAPDMGEGAFIACPADIRTKTEKTIQFKVLVSPTDKHPAQVEKWFEDKQIGQFTTTRYSGMVSPAEKSAYLDRIDTLIRAAKQARMRANMAEVEKYEVGDILMGFINGAKHPAAPETSPFYRERG